MFWNTRTKREAHALAKFLLHLREMSIGSNFDSFAGYCRNNQYEIHEEAQSFSDFQSGERRLSFIAREQPWQGAEFIFWVTSTKDVSGDQALSFHVQGQGRFFGFSVYGSGIPFRAEVRAYDKSAIGRDAPKLFAELLRLPGFKQFPALGDWRAWLED